VGALVGAILGGFLLAFLPPPLSVIAGACIGAFVGALAAELLRGKSAGHSFRVGIGAARGRLIGIVAKLVFGFSVLLVALWTALPLASKQPAPVIAGPATLSATTSR